MKSPTKINWWKKILLWFVAIALPMFLVSGVVVFYAVRIEPNRFEINRRSIQMKLWRPEHDGLKIVLLSDFHQGRQPEDFDRLNSIVAAVNGEKPDFIFLLGDYIGDAGRRCTPEDLAYVLGDLKSRYGVFAVLGNHDWAYDAGRIRLALEKYKITVLDNEYVSPMVNGKVLHILGLPDLSSCFRTFIKGVKRSPRREPVLVLAHNPDAFRFPQMEGELMLSGHTHGGQINLPYLRDLVVPSMYGSRYLAGLVDDGKRKVFVTSGLGTTILPVRIGVVPEIVVLTLKKQVFPKIAERP